MTLKHSYNSFMRNYDNLWVWAFRLGLYVLIGFTLGFILGIVIAMMVFFAFAWLGGIPTLIPLVSYILFATTFLGTATGFFWAELEIFRYYFSEPK